MRSFRIFALAVFCVSTAQAADPIGASKVAVDFTRDRLAKLLQVNQAEILVSAQRPFTNATVQLDFYHNGKKVHSEDSASATQLVAQDAVSISVQAADLDVVTLGGGKPGSSRFLVELTTSGGGPPMYAGRTHDVAKAVCSLGELNGASAFPTPMLHNGTIPLCWMLRDNATGDTSVTAGSSPEDLVAKNPTADIVVINLKLADDSSQPNSSTAAR